MTRTQLARRTTAHTRPAAVVRRIVGTPPEVAAAVALVRDSGRPLSMTSPRQIPGDSGRVTVTVRFLDNGRPAPVRRLRRGRVVAAVQLVHAVRAAFPPVSLEGALRRPRGRTDPRR